MQITVFGASGRVGQRVVALALERGHTVRAFAHSRNPFSPHERLQVFRGNVGNQALVDEALRGSQAVISCLGSWGTKNKNILTKGMQAILPVMAEQKISRIVTVTGPAAFWSKDKPSLLQRLARVGLLLIAPKILRDSEEHLRLLEASQLDWTCLRSPVMLRHGKPDHILKLQLPHPLATIPRAAVAWALVDLAEHVDYRQQAPSIYRA
jgi:putative NADH-flavin reductase